MTLLSFLRDADFVITIAIDVAVLCFSLPAYRRTKIKAFGFFYGGSAIGIIETLGSRLFIPSPFREMEDYQTYSEIYRVCYIAAAIMWGIGIILLIRHVLKEFDKKPPANS